MVRALDLRERRRAEPGPSRTTALVTYAEKIDGRRSRLDPGRSAAELERIVRALTPHIGAFLELESGDRLGVREAQARGRRRAGRGPCPSGRRARPRHRRRRAAAGAWSSRRAGARCPPTPTCAATASRGWPGRAWPRRRPGAPRSRSCGGPSSTDAWTDRALRSAAERHGLDGRDRAFAQRLAFGAVQRRGTQRPLRRAARRSPARPPGPAGAGGAAPRALRAALGAAGLRARRGRRGGRARQGRASAARGAGPAPGS